MWYRRRRQRSFFRRKPPRRRGFIKMKPFPRCKQCNLQKYLNSDHLCTQCAGEPERPMLELTPFQINGYFESRGCTPS